MRVLAVEDDEGIAHGLGLALRQQGWAVDIAPSVSAAWAALCAEPFEMVLLDLGLTDGDGLQVLQRLRAAPAGTLPDAATPVVIMTARDQIASRIAGLDTGADDYLTKPFSMSELIARIRAVLRRIRPGLADDRLNHGDIVIDRVAHRVRRSGQEIHLGPTEFRLLDHLMQHPGRVFSREQLLDAVWGSDVYVEARTVDVHVGRLRKALNVEGTVNPIRTVRSAGYSLDLGG